VASTVKARKCHWSSLPGRPEGAAGAVENGVGRVRSTGADVPAADEELIALEDDAAYLFTRAPTATPVVFTQTVTVIGYGSGPWRWRGRHTRPGRRRTKRCQTRPRPGWAADQGAIVALGEESNAVAPAASSSFQWPTSRGGGTEVVMVAIAACGERRQHEDGKQRAQNGSHWVLLRGKGAENSTTLARRYRAKMSPGRGATD